MGTRVRSRVGASAGLLNSHGGLLPPSSEPPDLTKSACAHASESGETAPTGELFVIGLR
jgi:hypothetical protein